MSLTTTQLYKDKFDELVKSWTPKLFIKDDNGKYVDFSDRVEINGKNLLKKIGNLSFVSEKKDGTGLSSSRAMSVVLDNSDRFFTEPFPALTTEDGSVAVFRDTQNAKQSILYNRDAQIRISVVFKDGREEEGVVATFSTGRMSRSKISPNVSLQLRDLSLPLRIQNSAERVRDGLSYFANRPIKFLLEECLKRQFANSSGGLPSSFNIPNKVSIESAASITGASGDQRVLSHFGKQPEQDTNGVWLRKGLICRSQVAGPTSSNLSSAASPVAPSPLPDEKTLYMGCDNELWKWDPVTEQSTLIDDSTLASGINIRYLWYSQEQLKIYGVAYAAVDRENLHTTTISVFKYDGTSLTVIKTISTVSPGEFCFRNGVNVGGDPSNVAVGQITSNEVGENVPILSPHNLTVRISHDLHNFSSITAGGTNDVGIEGLLDPGYYAAVTTSTQPANTIINISFTFGQKGFFVFNSQAVANVYLWYSTYDGSTEQTKIERISLTSGATQVIVSNFELNSGERIDPLCGCPNSSDDAIFVGGVHWDDGLGLTTSNGTLHKITAVGVETLLYNAPVDSSSANQYFTPLDVIHNSSKLLLTIFARDRVGESKAFIFAEHSDSSQADVAIKNTGRFQFVGLTEAKNDTDIIYFQETETGKLGYYNVTSELVTYADDGFPTVDNEFGLSIKDLAIDGDTFSGTLTDIVYGVSSPTPLVFDAYKFISNGKFYLYKVDKFYSGRIALFNTNGINILKAIEFLAQMSDHSWGFDRLGDFFFLPKSTLASTSDFEFRLDDINKRIIDLIADSGEDEVFNISRVSPYSVVLANINWEMKLAVREQINLATSTTEPTKPFDSDIFIQQKDDLRKSYRLECVSGGLVSSGNVRMRWRSIDEIFETSLIAVAVVAATTIRIANGIDSIRAGDSVRLEGASDVSETLTVSKNPTDSDKETGIVTFTTGIVNAYAISGTFVEVTNNLSQWSDQRGNFISDSYFENWTADAAPNELNDWVESDGNIDADEDSMANNFVFGKSTAKLTLTGGTDSYIYEDIVATEFKVDTRYSVLVYGRIDNVVKSSSIELRVDILNSGGAVLATVSASANSFDFQPIKVTFTTQSSPSGNVRIELHLKGSSGTIGWVDGCFLMEGENAVPDVLLMRNGAFVPISDSNLEIKFEAQGAETKMFVGDQIIIEAPGLENIREENSIISAVNIDSRNDYGDIEYPQVDNPYLGRSLARDVSERIVNEFAFPKYLIKIITPILPFIDFINSDTTKKITSITVVDEEVFKKSPSWEERGRLRSISDNLQSGISTFTLRALKKI